MITPENIDQIIKQIADVMGITDFDFEYNFDEKKLIITEK